MPRSNWSRRSFEAPGLELNPVETGSTAADLANRGITQFGATAAKTYDLAAPVEGAVKVLFCTDASTAAIQTVRASTGATINFFSTAGDEHIAKFSQDGDSIVLVGLSSVRWGVVANIGAVAFSTV